MICRCQPSRLTASLPHINKKELHCRLNAGTHSSQQTSTLQDPRKASGLLLRHLKACGHTQHSGDGSEMVSMLVDVTHAG